MYLPDPLLQQQPLLDHRTIVLPNEFDGRVFPMLSWAFDYLVESDSEEEAKAAGKKKAFTQEAVVLRVNGYGGSLSDLMACVDLLQMQAANLPLVGYLYGEAASAHSVFWAACPKRVIMPRSFLSVHSAASMGWQRLGVSDVNLLKLDLDASNLQMAQIYAAASAYDTAYWLGLLEQHPNSPLRIDAKALVDEYCMGTLFEANSPKT